MENIDVGIEIPSKKNGFKNGTGSHANGKHHCEECKEMAANNDEAIDFNPDEHEIVEVLFKGNRRSFYINKEKWIIKVDEKLVVESDNGIDLGIVTYVGEDAKARFRGCNKNKYVKFHVLRFASDEDMLKYHSNTNDEPIVAKKTREFAAQYGLDMKVTEAEWQLDRQRLTIYFTAPQRIDFRELVKELARAFKTRIELRQISTREEAKRIGGGIGCCGLNLCCTSFLYDFNHITLEHARLQQLSNNVAKLSGNCGRLKCCLLYEYKNYEEAFKHYPALHSTIETEEGRCRLIKVDIFKDISTVFYEEGKKYRTMEYEEIKKYMDAGKVKAPELHEAMSLFCDGQAQIKRDMHGEVYIEEK